MGEDITRDEARSIVANISGFFEVLSEWAAAQDAKVCNEKGN